MKAHGIEVDNHHRRQILKVTWLLCIVTMIICTVHVHVYTHYKLLLFLWWQITAKTGTPFAALSAFKQMKVQCVCDVYEGTVQCVQVCGVYEGTVCMWCVWKYSTVCNVCGVYEGTVCVWCVLVK